MCVSSCREWRIASRACWIASRVSSILCSAIAARGSFRFRSGLTRRRGRAAERVKKTLANAREREAYNCSSKLIENESVTAREHSRTQYAREKRNVFIILQVRTFANPYAHEKRNV